MDNIKVSIVIPVYKCEKYLEECLESLVNQTLKEIEIICVNDGSPDNSAEILDKFAQKDSRVVVINQENQGVSAARNNALKIAKGEFIGFVDSDDWVDLDFFEKLYNAAKQNNCDMAAGDFYRHGKIIKSKKLNYTKQEIFYNPIDKAKISNCPRYNYIWHKIYKKDILFANNLLFPTGVFYEDICWVVKSLYHLNGLVTVPNIFYHYRKNQGSIVTQKSDKNKNDYLNAVRQMINFMEEHGMGELTPHKLGKKDRVKLFGMNIMKIEYYYPSKIKYKLFGFIPFLEIDTYEKIL